MPQTDWVGAVIQIVLTSFGHYDVLQGGEKWRWVVVFVVVASATKRKLFSSKTGDAIRLAMSC